MLQTHNNANETQEDIVKRLAELTKWQEEQKKILEEKQTRQRQILGYEHRNMYHVLGLLHQQESFAENENYERIGDAEAPHKQNVKSASRTAPELKEMEDEDDDKATTTSTTGYYSEDVPEKVAQRPKRTFLKRGQGLKQRFKVDPDEFRLDKLPRYKFANAHPNLKKLGPKNSSSCKQKSQLQVKLVDKVAEPPPLDAQEKRFQQLLISSNNVCNSTPDSKASTTRSPKVRFAELPADNDDIIGAGPQPNSTLSSESNSMMPPISWSKVLDSQQIKPIGVQRIQIRSKPAEVVTQKENEEENLSIFELIEQKANDGTIDMNSSCIKRFMERKSHTKSNEADEIPVDKQLEEAGLKPLVGEVLNDDYSTTDGEDEHGECEATKNCDHSSSSSSRSETPQKVRVRFSDQHDTHEYVEETASETTDDNTLASSTDLLQQFKEALFSALQCRADQGQSDNDTASNANNSELIAQSSASTLSDDLQEKATLIKERLAKLEQEIDEFKENNLLLTKAKQQHELEKAQFQQERVEAMDRLNDEKIQMEIYLHDERMKIEDEKRKLEQQIRLQKSSANKKERAEIARLNQELELMQVQLKQKDQTHAAAQARLRTQIRNLEKDQKQLYDDIEQLNKEKKRLEMENWNLGRENNNKMLQEINRNIAKLAPKLSPVNCTINEDAVRRTKNVKPTASVSNSVTKFQIQKAPRKNSKATVTSRTRNDTKEPIVGNLSSESEDHNSSPIDDANDDDDEDDEYISKELHATDGKRHKENSANSTKFETSKESSAAPPVEFKREIINSDGSKDIWYPNGNLKKISADGMNVRMLYFNKDIKETNMNEGTVKYYYAETNTWHTTYLDGLEILEFPNGQTEHRHKNGTVEIHFANNSIKVTNPADEHTLEEWRFADGTNLIQMRNGDKVLMFPNGQKEVHTKLNKRREYPDGTVKLVYPDGSQETRYSNGRVRLKDKDGKLIMDTEND